MLHLGVARPGERLKLLCIGAHSDDIEIGAGATILSWIRAGVLLDVTWCVLSAGGLRGAEAENSAMAFLDGAARSSLRFGAFPDGFFPYHGSGIKSWMEALKDEPAPDIVLTHRRDDAHQDHREICQLTWNTFRNHLILEYEVPKWDGDLGQPNIYMPVSADALEGKIALLERHFASQRAKDWFDPAIFAGLARLRGMECRAPERYAEAFVLRKGLLG